VIGCAIGACYFNLYSSWRTRSTFYLAATSLRRVGCPAVPGAPRTRAQKRGCRYGRGYPCHAPQERQTLRDCAKVQVLDNDNADFPQQRPAAGQRSLRSGGCGAFFRRRDLCATRYRMVISRVTNKIQYTLSRNGSQDSAAKHAIPIPPASLKTSCVRPCCQHLGCCKQLTQMDDKHTLVNNFNTPC
jgi:hypothetical protein